MSEPRTEAGRDALAMLRESDCDLADSEFVAAILAIEAEAAAGPRDEGLDVERLAEAMFNVGPEDDYDVFAQDVAREYAAVAKASDHDYRTVSRVMDTSPDLFMVTTAEHDDRAFIAGARGQHEAEAAAGPRDLRASVIAFLDAWDTGPKGTRPAAVARLAAAIGDGRYEAEAAAGPRDYSQDLRVTTEAAAGPRENRADTIDSVGDAVNALRYIAQELDRLF